MTLLRLIQLAFSFNRKLSGIYFFANISFVVGRFQEMWYVCVVIKNFIGFELGDSSIIENFLSAKLAP